LHMQSFRDIFGVSFAYDFDKNSSNPCYYAVYNRFFSIQQALSMVIHYAE
ncbi:hypothetical protein SAMN04487897_1754, partial [Paenibacillus sp. yr247]